MLLNINVLEGDLAGVSLIIKPEYMNHPFISGNKLRKLKYNLQEARAHGYTTLVTFGGAYSNHIAATAAAGKEYGFNTIGIIRGEELVDKVAENPTLLFARDNGMQFKFVSRSVYRDKTNEAFIANLVDEFGNFYLVPEGGTNELAVKGCEEILVDGDEKFTHICCAVGTGGTISGLINASKKHQKVLGFPALKGDFLQNEIAKYTVRDNWELVTNYHFGGYGKTTPELIEFMNWFYENTNIPLDPVYTGKMFFGIYDMIKQGILKRKAKFLQYIPEDYKELKG